MNCEAHQVVGLLICQLLNVPTTDDVYLRDRAAQTSLQAATLDTEAADQTCHLTEAQYTDTGSASPSADPAMPGAWQGSHWSTTGMT